ncbi:hypothetical protein [Methylobacterium isbiliense]|nr:hypothetical protein [Methylobacterium isbiliense]MDN3621889.1 hypothetical protein [Methylobacterium isbiliense]
MIAEHVAEAHHERDKAREELTQLQNAVRSLVEKLAAELEWVEAYDQGAAGRMRDGVNALARLTTQLPSDLAR